MTIPPEPLTLTAALMAGFLGSGHCVGMCGAFALMPTTGAGPSRFAGTLLYNACRLLSYVMLGALMGGLGGQLGDWLDLPRWSLVLRVLTGGVIILIGLTLVLGDPRWAVAERMGSRIWRRLSPLALRVGRAPGVAGVAGLGLLWGLLPCGLVYSMLLAASVSGSAGNGAMTMAAFGLGTVPAMAGMGFFGRSGFARLRQPGVRRLAGAALIIGGIWLAAVPLYHAAQPEHHHSALFQGLDQQVAFQGRLGPVGVLHHQA